MANTTANDWDEGSPALTDPRRDGATEIVSLRAGIGDRLGKEHIDPAAGGVGGEHIAGSAMAYYQATAPTLRPDGVTALSSADYGRVWVDSDDKSVYTYTSGGWAPVKGSIALEISHFYKTFPDPWTGSRSQTGLADGQWFVLVFATLSGGLANEASYTASITVNSQTRSVVIDNHPDGSAPICLPFFITLTGGSGSIEVASSPSNIQRVTHMVGFRFEI